MDLLKKLLIAVAALAAALVVGGFLLPSTTHVERSVKIKAPQATVFTILNGFRQFRHWSPWADADPNMQVSFEGPPTGVGARQSWSGNDQVGTGSQEIIESTPWRQVRVRLVFGGFDGDFVATYAIEPDADGSRVTWALDGDYGTNLMGRYFGLLMDSMVGPDYEKGLAKLKDFAESLPGYDFSGLDVAAVEAVAQPMAFVASRSSTESRALGVALGVAYGKVSGFLAARDVEAAGPPTAVYLGESDGLVQFEAGLPVDGTGLEGEGEIRIGMTPAGKALRAVHVGSYRDLEATHRRLRAYLAAAGLETTGTWWEQYVDEFTDVPEAERVTHVYYGVN